VDYVSLRLANIYGPRNLSGPVPAFYRQLAAGKPCTVVDSRRDFVYVRDAVEVFARAATIGHGVYHVASGRDYAIRELYVAVREAMDMRPDEPELVPRGPDDAATILLDGSATEAAFDWTPSHSIAAGIAEAIEWYRAHGVRATFTHLTMKE
jgi:UDP-glucose 4-epimerase